VPLLALLFALGSPIFSQQEFIYALRQFFPVGHNELNFFWQIVERMEKSRGSVSIVSIIILTWASLRFFHALVHGVNRAWHLVEMRWWEGPLKNLAMLATLGSAVILGILAPVVLQTARNIAYSLEAFFLRSYFARLYPHIDLNFVFSLVDLGRYVLSTAVLFYAFSMLYMLAPRRKVKFSQIWLPAFLVTIFVQISQILFVNYLPRFINYNYVYGALGGLMFLLMWIYFCGLAILGGGCMCAAQARVAEEEESSSFPRKWS
jgi:membrane protein